MSNSTLRQYIYRLYFAITKQTEAAFYVAECLSHLYRQTTCTTAQQTWNGNFLVSVIVANDQTQQKARTICQWRIGLPWAYYILRTCREATSAVKDLCSRRCSGPAAASALHCQLADCLSLAALAFIPL